MILVLPRDGVPGVEPREGEGALGRLFLLSFVSGGKRMFKYPEDELTLPGGIDSEAFLRAISTVRCSIASSINLAQHRFGNISNRCSATLLTQPHYQPDFEFHADQTEVFCKLLSVRHSLQQATCHRLATRILVCLLGLLSQRALGSHTFLEFY